MNASSAIQTALAGTQNVFNRYLADLSDADLLVRPVPGANHIAWQLGHLIAAEIQLAGPQLPTVEYPALSPGFQEQYSKKGAGDDTPGHFFNKAEYTRLFNEVRGNTKAAVAVLEL